MPPWLSRSHLHRATQCLLRRRFTTLAIESSCDDTSVAILHTSDGLPAPASLCFHETITSPNRATGGIHPILSLTSHRRHLAALVRRSLTALPVGVEKPDLIAVTRGPGMVSSLAVGLDTAKGLAVAWNRPLIGVNHMLAHALTPRLVEALGEGEGAEFPFLTLLVSGGHTILVHSRVLVEHAVVAGSIDIAIGDMVDKVARQILPVEVLEKQDEAVAYGKVLEEFCFPLGEEDWCYAPPGTRERKAENGLKLEKWGNWKMAPPLRLHPRPDAFSFAGLGSAVERYMDANPEIGLAEKKVLGREAMMVAFEHVADRAVAALRSPQAEGIKSLVISGGVASNHFLRHLMRRYLDHAGFEHVQLVCPPVKYCTDNAAMIAWAGLELWRFGWHTDLEVLPIRKWSLDNSVECEDIDARGPKQRGGVLGVSGWVRR